MNNFNFVHIEKLHEHVHNWLQVSLVNIMVTNNISNDQITKWYCCSFLNKPVKRKYAAMFYVNVNENDLNQENK